MISKNILDQYIDLQAEAEETRKRIEKTKRQIAILEKETVQDTVKGGEGGIQRFKVEGFASADYGRQRSILFSRIALLQALENEIASTLNEVHMFINGINDSHMRRIITLRYVDGLSWNKVADEIGGGNTEDGVRMSFNRFMEKIS